MKSGVLKLPGRGQRKLRFPCHFWPLPGSWRGDNTAFGTEPSIVLQPSLITQSYNTVGFPLSRPQWVPTRRDKSLTVRTVRLLSQWFARGAGMLFFEQKATCSGIDWPKADRYLELRITKYESTRANSAILSRRSGRLGGGAQLWPHAPCAPRAAVVPLSVGDDTRRPATLPGRDHPVPRM